MSRLVDNTNCLDRAFNGSVPAHYYPSDAEQFQPSAIQFCADTKLLKGEGVEAITSFEARIPWFLTCLHTSKESLKGFVQIINNGLQGLREHPFGLWECLAIANSDLFLLGFGNAAPFQLI